MLLSVDYKKSNNWPNSIKNWLVEDRETLEFHLQSLDTSLIVEWLPII
jgi:hypothetical protein